MDRDEQKIVAHLEKKRDHLMTRLAERGGRSVGLAEHIDRLDAAIEALNGDLICQFCEAQLTGNA